MIGADPPKVGVDLGNLTNGAFNLGDLANTNGRAACFYAQLVQAVIPDSANLAVSTLASITSLVSQYVTPISQNLDCPEWTSTIRYVLALHCFAG
jgi:hypothetical protein